jgi:hypothetical protein
MPATVNTKFTLAYPDPASFATPRSLFRGSRQRTILCPFSLDANDAAGTVVKVGKIPSSAIILPSSTLLYGAVTGASINFGTPDDADCFMAAHSIAAAGSASAINAVAIANKAKRVWELAGLTNDPCREMDLLLTTTADATPGAAVACLFQIDYSDEQ